MAKRGGAPESRQNYRQNVAHKNKIQGIQHKGPEKGDENSLEIAIKQKLTEMNTFYIISYPLIGSSTVLEAAVAKANQNYIL